MKEEQPPPINEMHAQIFASAFVIRAHVDADVEAILRLCMREAIRRSQVIGITRALEEIDEP